jgi:U3 small nucleolar RNA-associated protein 18
VWVDPADAAVSVPVAAVSRLRKLRQYKGQTDMSGQQYEEALRRQHTILNPRTNWAAGSGSNSNKSSKVSAKAGTAAAAAAAAADYVIDDEAESDESAAQQLLLSGSGLLLGGGASTGGLLAAGSIEMSRLRDANGSSPSQAVVQALQFHPNGQLMLTAGFDKRLKLFQVSGCECRGGGLCVKAGGVVGDALWVRLCETDCLWATKGAWCLLLVGDKCLGG